MELAFTGAMAWTAWQVLGKLQRHAAKLEKAIDNGELLTQYEEYCSDMAVRRSTASVTPLPCTAGGGMACA
jgi:hypothetical protein